MSKQTGMSSNNKPGLHLLYVQQGLLLDAQYLQTGLQSVRSQQQGGGQPVEHSVAC